jgi:hypothetical protein
MVRFLSVLFPFCFCEVSCARRPPNCRAQYELRDARQVRKKVGVHNFSKHARISAQRR